MNEEDSTQVPPNEQNIPAAETAAATTVDAPPPVELPAKLDVNELQALDPAEIEKLCRDFELRAYPGRSRHHLILDLIRAALGRKIPVTATGFFDPVDSFAVLRWPRLNFLPVPEDVGVPRAFIQQFKFRPAQKISGTLRLPRDREKLIMLDEVKEIEGVPAEEWVEPTEFDNSLLTWGGSCENSKTNSISARAVDLLARSAGQRG